MAKKHSTVQHRSEKVKLSTERARHVVRGSFTIMCDTCAKSSHSVITIVWEFKHARFECTSCGTSQIIHMGDL